MDARKYRLMIIDAVKRDDQKTLALFAGHVMQAEQAVQILRAKGYGHTGQSIVDTVRKLPEVRRK